MSIIRKFLDKHIHFQSAELRLTEERSTLDYFERMKQYNMTVNELSQQEFHMLVTADVSCSRAGTMSSCSRTAFIVHL